MVKKKRVEEINIKKSKFFIYSKVYLKFTNITRTNLNAADVHLSFDE